MRGTETETESDGTRYTIAAMQEARVGGQGGAVISRGNKKKPWSVRQVRLGGSWLVRATKGLWGGWILLPYAAAHRCKYLGWCFGGAQVCDAKPPEGPRKEGQDSRLESIGTTWRWLGLALTAEHGCKARRPRVSRSRGTL